MKFSKLFFIFVFCILSYTIIYSEDNIPRLFQLEWGSSFEDVYAKITNKNSGLGIDRLTYYPVFKDKNEAYDLTFSPLIKYNSKGIPFLNIPGEIIFSFYNSNSEKSGLKLSKIEVYLNRKDNNNIWVDTKEVFKNLINFFCENYNINLKYSQERQIFSDWNYHVTVNGIFTTFIGNIGQNVLDKNTSIFISYENNNYQNMILKKEKDLENEKSNDYKSGSDKTIKDLKKNL